MLRPKHRAPEKPVQVMELGEDWTFEYVSDVHATDDLYAVIKSSKYPSPVQVRKSKLSGLFYFSAEWALPSAVSDGSYTTLTTLLRHAGLHLHPEKIGSPKAAPARDEPKAVDVIKTAEKPTQVNQGEVDGIQYVEKYYRTSAMSHDLSVTFTHPDFPEPLVAIRKANEPHLRFYDDGRLPVELMGYYTTAADARQAISKYVEAKAFEQS